MRPPSSRQGPITSEGYHRCDSYAIPSLCGRLLGISPLTTMAILPILFWILLILSVIGTFAPAPYQVWGGRLSLVLFVILGLRVFPLVLN